MKNLLFVLVLVLPVFELISGMACLPLADVPDTSGGIMREDDATNRRVVGEEDTRGGVPSHEQRPERGL